MALLPDIELKAGSELAALQQTATPSQMKIITAMLSSALKALQEG